METNKDRKFFRSFGSIGALVRYLDNATVQPYFVDAGCSSQKTGNEYYGYDSYEDARKFLLYGDKDLAKSVFSTDKLNMSCENTRPTMRVFESVAGIAPHVPNYIAGVPNSMIMAEMVEVPAPVITVVYNIGVLGSVSAEEIKEASARVLSAIMSLEKQGIQVNLYVASAQTEGSQRCGFLVKIKNNGQYIDPLKMAVPMISPAMNRRFGFRYRETMPGLNKGWSDGYGSSMYIEDFRKWLNDMGVQYDCALTFMDVRNVSSVQELERLFIEGAKKAQVRKH